MNLELERAHASLGIERSDRRDPANSRLNKAITRNARRALRAMRGARA